MRLDLRPGSECYDALWAGVEGEQDSCSKKGACTRSFEHGSIPITCMRSHV